MAEDIQPKDKFIAFIDILGFRAMVHSAETGHRMSMHELVDIVKMLGSEKDREHFIKFGPTICPRSQYERRDLDFQVTQVSDCVIVSAEISPAGVINLINHCSGAVLRLLTKGIMCRGYIKRGMIYHNRDQFMGSGYIDAYEREHQVKVFRQDADERGTPFVEIDTEVVQYVTAAGDECVKKMFSRYVKTDGALTAIFPFKSFSHSFMLAGHGVKFDPEKEKTSNQNLRNWLQDFKANILKFVDQSNADVVRKSQHYIRALDAQLAQCDKTDAFIDHWAGINTER